MRPLHLTAHTKMHELICIIFGTLQRCSVLNTCAKLYVHQIYNKNWRHWATELTSCFSLTNSSDATAFQQQLHLSSHVHQFAQTLTGFNTDWRHLVKTKTVFTYYTHARQLSQTERTTHSRRRHYSLTPARVSTNHHCKSCLQQAQCSIRPWTASVFPSCDTCWVLILIVFSNLTKLFLFHILCHSTHEKWNPNCWLLDEQGVDGCVLNKQHWSVKLYKLVHTLWRCQQSNVSRQTSVVKRSGLVSWVTR